jgi:hypothetical protein
VYAITRFRDYVIQHLRAWHEFCNENYLLDWGSKYNVPRERKRKRTCIEGEDLALPSWTKSLSREAQDKIQVRAKKSLETALDGEREYERNLKMVRRMFPGGQVIQEGTASSGSLTECRYRY